MIALFSVFASLAAFAGGGGDCSYDPGYYAAKVLSEGGFKCSEPESSGAITRYECTRPAREEQGAETLELGVQFDENDPDGDCNAVESAWIAVDGDRSCATNRSLELLSEGYAAAGGKCETRKRGKGTRTICQPDAKWEGYKDLFIVDQKNHRSDCTNKIRKIYFTTRQMQQIWDME